MTGGSIDPDLAASLKARDRHIAAAAHSTIGFSSLLCERSQPAETRPASPWCRLRLALKRLSAN